MPDQRKAYPPLGKLVSAGTHRLHALVEGKGSPTVILESGGMSWCMDWTAVQAGVARFTRVLAYDRAGFGWSEAGPRPRTAGRMAQELHTLLFNAGLPGPYVLVGASFGGHIMRLFAAQHPGEVCGLLLLDARHEAVDERMPPAWKKQQASGPGMYRAMALIARLGLFPVLGKLMGEKARPPALKILPPELQPAYLAVGYRPAYFEANLEEFLGIAESDGQVRAAGSLGEMPLRVIRHGRPDLFAGLPAADRPAAESVWQALQGELAGLSGNSRLTVAEESGHAIQIDQPEVVVVAIRELCAG